MMQVAENRTGPVRVLLLFVLQVPFKFGADVCCAATSVDAATAAAREYRILLSSPPIAQFPSLDVARAFSVCYRRDCVAARKMVCSGACVVVARGWQSLFEPPWGSGGKR